MESRRNYQFPNLTQNFANDNDNNEPLSLYDESQIDLICCSMQKDLGLERQYDLPPTSCENFDSLTDSSTHNENLRKFRSKMSENSSCFRQKSFSDLNSTKESPPIQNSARTNDWFSSFKSNCSSSLSENSIGYGSFRGSEKNSSSFFAEDERFSTSSADFDGYYSGASSSASSTISTNQRPSPSTSGFDENAIDALYRNAEFYDLETVELGGESSKNCDNLNLEESDILDDVQPSSDLARANIAEMAQCVLSMISDLKNPGGGSRPQRARAASPLRKQSSSFGLESIPESHEKESTEHIYEEIHYDSAKIDLSGAQPPPPPLPARNFHSSMITVSSCPNCNCTAFAPKEKFVRRSLPPSKRYQVNVNKKEEQPWFVSNAISVKNWDFSGKRAPPRPPNRATSLNSLTTQEKPSSSQFSETDPDSGFWGLNKNKIPESGKLCGKSRSRSVSSSARFSVSNLNREKLDKNLSLSGNCIFDLGKKKQDSSRDCANFKLFPSAKQRGRIVTGMSRTTTEV